MTSDATVEPKQFAQDFVWWFQKWDHVKYKETVYNGKWYPVAPGVPLDKIGSGSDTEYHRVAHRLAEWKPKTGTSKNDPAELIQSLPQTLSSGQFYKGQRGSDRAVRQYHVPLYRISGLNGHARMLTFVNFVGNNPELAEQLYEKLNVPQEVRDYYDQLLSYENEIILVEDIAKGLQEYDYIPDASIDEMLDGVFQWGRDLTLFGESGCDP